MSSGCGHPGEGSAVSIVWSPAATQVAELGGALCGSWPSQMGAWALALPPGSLPMTLSTLALPSAHACVRPAVLAVGMGSLEKSPICKRCGRRESPAVTKVGAWHPCCCGLCLQGKGCGGEAPGRDWFCAATNHISPPTQSPPAPLGSWAVCAGLGAGQGLRGRHRLQRQSPTPAPLCSSAPVTLASMPCPCLGVLTCRMGPVLLSLPHLGARCPGRVPEERALPAVQSVHPRDEFEVRLNLGSVWC